MGDEGLGHLVEGGDPAEGDQQSEVGRGEGRRGDARSDALGAGLLIGFSLESTVSAVRRPLLGDRVSAVWARPERWVCSPGRAEAMSATLDRGHHGRGDCGHDLVAGWASAGLMFVAAAARTADRSCAKNGLVFRAASTPGQRGCRPGRSARWSDRPSWSRPTGPSPRRRSCSSRGRTRRRCCRPTPRSSSSFHRARSERRRGDLAVRHAPGRGGLHHELGEPGRPGIISTLPALASLTVAGSKGLSRETDPSPSSGSTRPRDPGAPRVSRVDLHFGRR